jgi:hypothetical protein
MHIEIGGRIALDLVEELAEVAGAVASHAFADDSSGFHVESGKERGGSVSLVVACAQLRVPRGRIGNGGWVRSSACTWLFSSTLSTTARSGGNR